MKHNFSSFCFFKKTYEHGSTQTPKIFMHFTNSRGPKIIHVHKLKKLKFIIHICFTVSTVILIVIVQSM